MIFKAGRKNYLFIFLPLKPLLESDLRKLFEELLPLLLSLEYDLLDEPELLRLPELPPREYELPELLPLEYDLPDEPELFRPLKYEPPELPPLEYDLPEELELVRPRE